MIVMVSLLLALCVAVDYATNDTDTITSNETSIVIPEDVTFVNGSYVLPEDAGIAKTDGKVYTDKVKPKRNIITATGKPSCGCRYSYAWHTRTYVNYCPNCGRYNALCNKHKYPARYEQELTCRYCDCDYCICCGKMKYSWSHVYLVGDVKDGY